MMCFGKMGAIVCLLLTLIASETAVCGAADDGKGLRVTTLAGGGDYGFSDGRGAQASFLLPAGVAVDANGAIFVADEAAQRIRRIANDGVVSTVAGSGPIGKLGFSVEGGYRDGPAAEARFNHPVAIAFGPDGALYIADMRNACIRRLYKGVVSTIIGKPGERGENDGGLSTARLMAPVSLSFDAKGVLWIGDSGVGLRRLGRDGILRTVQIVVDGHPYATAGVISVSASPDTDDPIIFIAMRRSYVVWHVNTEKAEVEGEYLADEGDRYFGYVYQALAIGHGQVLFTDAGSNDVRYLRIRFPSFASFVTTEVIAGGWEERGSQNAGYIDGELEKARFYGPRGLALRGGHLIIADAGNRVIRDVELPRFRVPEAGFANDGPYDSAHYEIAYIGASWTFYDTDGPGSICDVLEERLNGSHLSTLPIRCHTIRMDSASVNAIESYISNYLADRKVDLVIMSLEPWNTSPESLGRPLEAVRARLSRKAELMVTWQYENFMLSLDEELILRATEPDNFDYFPEEVAADIDARRSADNDELVKTHILMYDPLDALRKYELEGRHLPLYFASDKHMNPQGTALIANGIADFLISGKYVR